MHRHVDDPPAFIRAESGLDRVADRVAELWPEAARSVAAGVELREPAPVEVVLLSGDTFRGWARGLLPEWGVGYASWPAGPIAIDVDGVLRGKKTLDEVLRHEISHVYLGQRLEGVRPPRWFVEGVAQAQSGEWRFGDTLGLVQAASTGSLPPLARLGSSFPQGGRAADLAYRVSLQAVLDLDGRLADQGGWRALVSRSSETGRFDVAFEEMVGMRLVEYDAELVGKLRGRYGWIAAVASATTLFSAMTVVFLIGAARSWLRKRRRLREMEEEEARLDFPRPPLVP